MPILVQSSNLRHPNTCCCRVGTLQVTRHGSGSGSHQSPHRSDQKQHSTNHDGPGKGAQGCSSSTATVGLRFGQNCLCVWVTTSSTAFFCEQQRVHIYLDSEIATLHWRRNQRQHQHQQFMLKPALHQQCGALTHSCSTRPQTWGCGHRLGSMATMVWIHKATYSLAGFGAPAQHTDSTWQ